MKSGNENNVSELKQWKQAADVAHEVIISAMPFLHLVYKPVRVCNPGIFQGKKDPSTRCVEKVAVCKASSTGDLGKLKL